MAPPMKQLLTWSLSAARPFDSPTKRNTTAGNKIHKGRRQQNCLTRLFIPNVVLSRIKLRRVSTFREPFIDPIPNVIVKVDRKSTRLNSSHVSISYAVFCLKKKQGRSQLFGQERR